MTKLMFQNNYLNYFAFRGARLRITSEIFESSGEYIGYWPHTSWIPARYWPDTSQVPAGYWLALRYPLPP